ncbi:uncharacterized protein LOC116301054 [Actinia tenebrosa]|uniref:Uncharacterized protein LOC116301054 n=1 Tax=Actinia tenebrosa TaxID=6105 RepID=A0A6P8IGK2_ACTTE|nr:uncharacterized protein LOC116301054 [Actinia tenebrosa]
MPYKEKQNCPSLAEKESSLITSKQRLEWQPKRSQIKASQQISFQKLTDKLSGGIQYWTKQKHPQSMQKYKEYIASNQKISRNNRCGKCGGFLNEESKIRFFLNEKPTEPNCIFGREYCDVIGPCADCSLLNQRNAIVRRQILEFPDLEVTPRRLVAPFVANTILTQALSNETSSSIEVFHPSNSFMKLPAISPETLRYTRKETGSRKQRRLKAPQENKTTKTYIEVRLPKI